MRLEHVVVGYSSEQLRRLEEEGLLQVEVEKHQVAAVLLRSEVVAREL